MVLVKVGILDKQLPKFMDVSELTYEQLTDPDYSLRQLVRDAGIDETKMLICSKCHHCR